MKRIYKLQNTISFTEVSLHCLQDSFPHLIIAPNAGVAAYSSWKETVVCLAQLNLYTLLETVITRNAQTSFEIQSMSAAKLVPINQSTVCRTAMAYVGNP